MKTLGLLSMLALGLLVAGCASENPPAPRTESQGRTRCLNDRNETGNTRPLFFLFCVESP
jgi:hypothetical protein